MEDSERSRALAVELLRISRPQDGRIPFSQFMEVVLYAPQWGYYGRPQVFGPAGDFQTAPRIHPVFGATVAREAVREWERLDRPKGFTFIELGAGEGMLTRDVVRSVHETIGEAVQGWNVLLIDRFPRDQKAPDPEWAVAPKWSRSLEGVPAGPGVAIANELLDALPFHILERTAKGWEERWVRVEGSSGGAAHLGWETGPLSEPGLDSILPQSAPEGTVAEVTTHYRALFAQLARVLEEGEALFFDYGDSRDGLLERMPRGTMETFRHHAAGTSPLENLGGTDIGCWVDFTQAGREAAETGWEVESLTSQGQALHDWGMDEVVRGFQARDPVEGVRAHLARKAYHFGYADHRVLRLRRARRVREPFSAARTR